MKHFLSVIAFIMYSCVSLAQNKIFILDTTNSGIPSNSISALLFDNSQNLWVGTTDKGAGMFDGSKWTYFNTSNTPALLSNYINDIKQHPNGDMWFGTGLGIAVKSGSNWMTYDTTVIKYYQLTAKKFQLYIQFDSKGDAYTISIDQAASATLIYKYNGSGWSVINSDTATIANFIYPRRFVIDQNDQIWTKDGWHYDGAKWKELKHTNPDLRGSLKNGVAIDNNNHVWFYLADLGKSATETVFRYDGSTVQEFYDLNFTRYGDQNGYLAVNPHNNTVYSAVNGISWYNGMGWNKDTSLNKAIYSSPLHGIKAMEFDQKGNTWIGLVSDLEMYKITPDKGGIIIYNENGVDLTDFNVGINDHETIAGELTLVFPNPFTNRLFITSKHSGNLQLDIFDASGKMVSQYNIPSGNQIVNTAELNNGLYFYDITDRGIRVSCGKLIKN